MNTYPSRESPVVGAIETLVGRWLSQEPARANAARAATRLHHQRREHDEVTRFLATQQRQSRSQALDATTRDRPRGPRTLSRGP
jgi:hypothetical protein